MTWLLSLLNWFATGYGVLFVCALAGLIVLARDWRLALPALFIIQVGVAANIELIYKIPAQWATVQTLVLGLCCTMLAVAAVQAQVTQNARQSGGWFFRLLVMGLLALAWRIFGLTIWLPVFSSQTTQLLAWLAVVSILLLSLGDHSLFTGVALLLWCTLAQAVVVVLAPIPELVAFIGLAELLLAFTCSYLLLAENMPAAQPKMVLTDATFPTNGNGLAPVVFNQATAPVSASFPAGREPDPTKRVVTGGSQ